MSFLIRYPYNTRKGFEGFDPKKYDTDFLPGLYREMLRMRLIEEAIEAEYSKDEMKTPIHLVIGQEASSVGVCAALRKSDLVFSTHRTHGNYLAKGGSLKAMMSELYCRLDGCAGSRGGSMHLVDKSVGMAGTSAIVGASAPLATGAALTAQMTGKDYVTVGFFGDAATEEGVHWESLNFAALRKLPVVFVCENNFYSVCSALNVRQPTVEIYKKAEAFGLPSVKVDGSNVLAVYEATRLAAERARSGGGPSYIETVAYRWRGHGGAGDDSHTGYRDVEEVKHWQEVCPLRRFYDYLVGLGCMDETRQSRMADDIQREIKESFDHARNSANPEEKDLLTHVYCD